MKRTCLESSPALPSELRPHFCGDEPRPIAVRSFQVIGDVAPVSLMASVLDSMRQVSGVEQEGSGVQPTFKRLGIEDIQLLRHVAEDVFDHPIDFDFAKGFLSDARNILIVALDGDLVIAQVVAVVHQHLDAPPDLFIDNLGVTPAWQRRGLGRRLLALAFTAGAEQGAKAAWVGTEEDNMPANALYENTGASAGRFMMFSYSTIEPAEDSESQ